MATNKCHDTSCPAYIVCDKGIGNLIPARFQCGACGRDIIVMEGPGTTVTLANSFGLRPGDTLDIAGEILSIQDVTFNLSGNTEITAFRQDPVHDQIEYDDEDRCGSLVEQQKPDRICRRCFESET